MQSISIEAYTDNPSVIADPRVEYTSPSTTGVLKFTVISAGKLILLKSNILDKRKGPTSHLNKSLYHHHLQNQNPGDAKVDVIVRDTGSPTTGPQLAGSSFTAEVSRNLNDCVWSWTQWSTCSASCGKKGD